MKLITWNVAGRVGKLQEQINFIEQANPDVLTLQEITEKTLPLFKDHLTELGYHYLVSSIDLTEDKSIFQGARKYGTLIASKWPISKSTIGGEGIDWPERFLTTHVETPTKLITVHTTYIPPGSSNGWKKIELLEGIYKTLSQDLNTFTILTGDFNSPQEEMDNGEVHTWASSKNKAGIYKLKKSRGERWDNGERNIISGLKDYDLEDVYRKLYGYEKQEYSWVAKREGKEWGRRFDHVFAAKELNPIEAKYVHEVRTEKISDHSAMEVTFDN